MNDLKRLVLLALLLATSGCSNPFAPETIFVNKVAWDPPDAYGIVYADVEKCVGKTGDFSGIMWFLADEIIEDGVSYGGSWNPDHEIVLLRDSIWSQIPAHEMIHDILGGNRHHENWPTHCEIKVILVVFQIEELEEPR